MIPAALHSLGREVTAVIILGAAFIGLSIFCQYRTGIVRIELEIQSEQDDELKIYWRAGEATFEEEHLWKTDLQSAAITQFSARLPAAPHIDFLRFDPGTAPGRFTISKAKLIYEHQSEHDLLEMIRSDSLMQTNQLRVKPLQDGVLIETFGDDPFFELAAAEPEPFLSLWQSLVIIFGFSLLFLVLMNQRLMKGSRRSGQLQITLPPQTTVHLPPDQKRPWRLQPRMSCRSTDQSVTYTIMVQSIEAQSIRELLETFKQANQQAHIRFQFSRSAEI